MMKDLKKPVLFALVVVLLLAIVGAVDQLYPDKAEARLNTFSSYEELKNFVNTSKQTSYPNNYGWFGPRSNLLTSSPAQLTTMAAERADAPEYSTTNVQVEGVDEADIVKTDGEYIYIVSGGNITTVKAYPPAEADIVSQIRLNATVQGLFINDDKLVAIGGMSPYEMYRMSMPVYVPYTSRTFIKVYNVADRANPVSERNVSLDGDYFTSRMIGDFVYVIVNEPVYQMVYPLNASAYSEVALPKLYLNDKTVEVPATQIYYSNVSDRFETYTHVIAINLFNDAQEPTLKTFLLGWASTTYVSQGNIYITFSTYESGVYYVQKTIVHRIRIAEGEIDGEASGEVSGHVLNQFSMDEHNGYFRIATTTGTLWASGEAASENHIYILDSNLEIAGKLENLAPGEKIYSARFMDDRGYLVTFKKVDPFFVLDLSDPTFPKVLGQLKITGYSDYLHPYDENHVIGMGKETIEAEGGNFAWYQGVKISLFDVTDVADPKEIAKYEIGKRGTDSPVLRDHKAFLFDKSRSLLVLPVRVVEQDYAGAAWDGAYVFHISIEGGLELKGKITHIDSEAEPTKNWYSYNPQYSVQRSLYIDNVLYTISSMKIKMNSLSDLTELNEIKLNQ